MKRWVLELYRIPSCILVRSFIPAVRHKAASLVLVHNHPSGDPTPSPHDFEVTDSLIQAGKLMGIPINDHIIIGNQGYVSLRQKGIKFN